MNEKISSEKALSDLNIIKKTIDRTNQADTIADMFKSMGTLMIVGGVIILFLCVITYFLIQPNGLTLEVKKQLIVIWTSSMVLLGILKVLTFKKKSKELNLSLWGYLSKTLKGSFIALDLPLELSAGVILIFLFKIGLSEYIPALTAIWIGELFAIMGSVFINKSFTKAGYLYIALGSIGLLFMGEHVLLFIAITYGLVMLIFGVLILLSSSKKEEVAKNEQ